MTKNAKVILSIVGQSQEHLTAEQIFLEMKARHEDVSLATVYNNLNALCSQGRIRRVSVEGQPDRFDRMERHDHLVCVQCGRLQDVYLQDLTQTLTQQLDVPLVAYDLRLLYVCEACRKQREESS